VNPLDGIRALLAEVTAEAGLLLPAPAVSLLLFFCCTGWE